MHVTTIRWGSIQEASFTDLLKQSEKTILYFYPKNNTPGCTVEAQDFTRLAAAFTEHNIQIIWVSKDTPESHCTFIAKHDLTPLYISDEELILHKQYDAYGEKKNYGKTYMGVIRGTVLLDSNGTILKHWKNVRAKEHAQRVLDYVTNQSKITQ